MGTGRGRRGSNVIYLNAKKSRKPLAYAHGPEFRPRVCSNLPIRDREGVTMALRAAEGDEDALGSST